MKLLPIISMAVLLVKISLAQEGPPIPSEIRNLIHRDFAYQEGKTPGEAYDSWVKEVKGSQGVTPDLIKLFNWSYEKQDDYQLIDSALAALKFREDIPPDDLKRITNLIESLLYKASSERNEFERAVVSGVDIVENYPSKEHEDLLLLALNDSDSLVQAAAANGLARIGSRRALPSLHKLKDLKGARAEGIGLVRSRVLAALQAIENRASSSQTGFDVDVGKESFVENTVKKDKSMGEIVLPVRRLNFVWIVGGIAIILVIALLFGRRLFGMK